MKGCKGIVLSAVVGTILWLAILVACRAVTANEPGTAVYIQYVAYRPSIGAAWCVGCPESGQEIGGYWWYACCSTCPPAGSARIPIIRPTGSYWADCPADYNGHLLTGNEETLPAQQMANFIITVRNAHPYAILVCLNDFDTDRMLSVMALLPPGTCNIYGVHIYEDVDVSGWLDQLCFNCRIWVTETGWCNSDRNAYSILNRLVIEMRQDRRVERIFGYTPVGGTHPCLDMLESDGSPNSTGLAFLNAVEAYP